MTYKYRFTKRSSKQRDEIIEWYAKQSAQATERFVAELYEIIDKICLDPFRYRNTYKSFREIFWKRYRYYVIFFIDETINEIVIFSLYHSAKNPKNKYGAR